MEIQFFHFPKSGTVQDILESRIKDCVEKYAQNITTIKVHFSDPALAEHHMKIVIHGSGHFNGFVNSTAVDVPHAIEKCMEKLEVLLRKASAKHKHMKSEFSNQGDDSSYNVTNLRYKKHILGKFPEENAFDKYENSFVSDFEDSEPVKHPKKKAS